MGVGGRGRLCVRGRGRKETNVMKVVYPPPRLKSRVEKECQGQDFALYGVFESNVVRHLRYLFLVLLGVFCFWRLSRFSVRTLCPAFWGRVSRSRACAVKGEVRRM